MSIEWYSLVFTFFFFSAQFDIPYLLLFVQVTLSHFSKFKIIVGMLLLGSAKVNKVKIFLGPCYTIKCVLTFVSGVQESVLVDFISQNFA